MNGQEESSLQTEPQIARECAFLIFVSIVKIAKVPVIQDKETTKRRLFELRAESSVHTAATAFSSQPFLHQHVNIKKALVSIAAFHKKSLLGKELSRWHDPHITFTDILSCSPEAKSSTLCELDGKPGRQRQCF
ncbi:High Affinity Camp-Specific And Ibmx-Insensitive 3',5'-Cyclic Phosphodiesterase 8B [Manis pentadactyla]|nr:High Affinity Camp-Specific And Ibmx-Insensitive 3',5'-Cyclic Phosphodiesterase 8B [Manis pentadactyla]